MNYNWNIRVAINSRVRTFGRLTVSNPNGLINALKVILLQNNFFILICRRHHDGDCEMHQTNVFHF